jgi:hypothetical protein
MRIVHNVRIYSTQTICIFLIGILWKRIKLKGNDLYPRQCFPDDYNYCEKDRSQLEKFIKLVREKQKPVYSSNITHLEISYYHSL